MTPSFMSMREAIDAGADAFFDVLRDGRQESAGHDGLEIVGQQQPLRALAGGVVVHDAALEPLVDEVVVVRIIPGLQVGAPQISRLIRPSSESCGFLVNLCRHCAVHVVPKFTGSHRRYSGACVCMNWTIFVA